MLYFSKEKYSRAFGAQNCYYYCRNIIKKAFAELKSAAGEKFFKISHFYEIFNDFLVRIPKNFQKKILMHFCFKFLAPCEGLWFFSPFASEGRGGGDPPPTCSCMNIVNVINK